MEEPGIDGQHRQSGQHQTAGQSLPDTVFSWTRIRSSLPPPDTTLSRILSALHCHADDAEIMREIAASERGFAPQDAALPDEVQRLIGDLRAHGPTLPMRFIRALRTTIREAAN